MPEFDVVTGAFGYTGRYVTARLLESGRSVTTLTGHPNRPNPFADRVAVARFDFEDRRKLAGHLSGAATLYNTYWVRFPRGDVSFYRAVTNSETLIQAAMDAGVRRIVHVSITNPSEDSPFAYFRGKAMVERMIRDSGLAYSIVRPTVIFGGKTSSSTTSPTSCVGFRSSGSPARVRTDFGRYRWRTWPTSACSPDSRKPTR
jgi:uncharacterized protein YbjT (DUF2867 family)